MKALWQIFVDGSGDVLTIQAGVDRSSAGDSVLKSRYLPDH